MRQPWIIFWILGLPLRIVVAMDDLFLLLIIAACASLLYAHGTSREAAVRLLGLTTAGGQKFFEAIHASQNRRLFRDHFRIDAGAFDELFVRCRPFIRDTVRDQRDVPAVALHWIGNAPADFILTTTRLSEQSMARIFELRLRAKTLYGFEITTDSSRRTFLFLVTGI